MSFIVLKFKEVLLRKRLLKKPTLNNKSGKIAMKKKSDYLITL